MIKVISHSSVETKSLAENLAKLLVNGEILALAGPLGSGKTTFIKGLAKGLKIAQKIRSPSFVMVIPYKLSLRNRKKAKTFYHLDLYRLKRITELRELGFFEILLQKNRLLAIEWPEKVKKFLPRHTIYLSFALGKTASERIIKIWQKN